MLRDIRVWGVAQWVMGEAGFGGHFAQQQFIRPNFRFGSKADITLGPLNVRFTPNSGQASAR
jgi:hypothetical protein